MCVNLFIYRFVCLFFFILVDCWWWYCFFINRFNYLFYACFPVWQQHSKHLAKRLFSHRVKIVYIRIVDNCKLLTSHFSFTLISCWCWIVSLFLPILFHAPFFCSSSSSSLIPFRSFVQYVFDGCIENSCTHRECTEMRNCRVDAFFLVSLLFTIAAIDMCVCFFIHLNVVLIAANGSIIIAVEKLIKHRLTFQSPQRLIRFLLQLFFLKKTKICFALARTSADRQQTNLEK